MNKKTYLVFVIFAYDVESSNGDFLYSVRLEMIAKTEEEAVNKAKKLVLKKNYYLKEIYEKYAES